MQTSSADGLRVEKGQRLTPQHWNRLISWIEKELTVSGDAFYNQTPSGRFFYGGGGSGGNSSVDHPWQITMNGGLEDGLKLQFRRALVNGVEPRVGDTPIGKVDEKGERPALEVKAEQFGADRLCRVYAKATLQAQSFYVQKVETIAKGTDAVSEALTAYKLVAFLMKEGEGARVEQMCFFNQSLAVAQPRGNGRARYLWTAT